MPPKAGKGQEKVPEQHVDAEQQRLQGKAYDQGVLSRTRRVCTTSLPPTKHMIRADGKDIVKKSSTRKNRYLLVFNCQIAPAAAGKLGTFAQLDSRNPVLYIEFPEGRLKLLGTLAFPRNKYMVLKLGAKEALCEDVLESMIVFSEARWVGTAEENPEERVLPMPPSLTDRRHDKYEFSSRGSVGNAGGKEAAIDDEDMVEDEDEPPSQRPQRAATRTERGKRQRYNEDSDEEEDDFEEGLEGTEDEGPRKLPKLHPSSQQKQAQQRKQRQQAMAAGAGADDEAVVVGEDGPAAGPKGKGKGKQGSLDLFLMNPPAPAAGKATPKSAAKPNATPSAAAKSKAIKPAPRSTGVGKRKAAAGRGSEGDDGEDVVDLAGSSDDGQGAGGARRAGEQPSQPPSSARPRRAAAGEAAKRLRIESDSEDEDEESGSGQASDEEGGGGSAEAGGTDEDAEGSDEGEEEQEVSDDEDDQGDSPEGSDYIPSD